MDFFLIARSYRTMRRNTRITKVYSTLHLTLYIGESLHSIELRDKRL